MFSYLPQYDELFWFLAIMIMVFWVVSETSWNPVSDVEAVRSARFFPPFPFYVGTEFENAISKYSWADLDDTIVFKMGWFANWNDETIASNLPILGTHHSLTYTINSVVGLFAKTQRLTLNQQLKIGVRCFDLRFKFGDDGKLHAFHDVLPLYISWAFVWRTFIDFLDTNESECIFVIIRDESYTNHTAVATAAFKEVPEDVVQSRFVRNLNFTKLVEVPLSQLRNKIVFVNFDGTTVMPWSDNTNFTQGSVYVSDKYSFESSTDAYKSKVNFVRETYAGLTTKYFNIIFNSLANKSFSNSVRWNGINLRKDFLAWRKSSKQPVKGAVIMYDWVWLPQSEVVLVEFG